MNQRTNFDEYLEEQLKDPGFAAREIPNLQRASGRLGRPGMWPCN